MLKLFEYKLLDFWLFTIANLICGVPLGKKYFSMYTHCSPLVESKFYLQSIKREKNW